MLSYQPASQPSRPWWTRSSVAPLAGLVRSTTKWARPRAPRTTTRATTKGSRASRSDSGSRATDGRAKRRARAGRRGRRGLGRRAAPRHGLTMSRTGEDELGQVHGLVEERRPVGTKLRPPPPLLVASVLRSAAIVSHLIAVGLVAGLPDQPDGVVPAGLAGPGSRRRRSGSPRGPSWRSRPSPRWPGWCGGGR